MTSKLTKIHLLVSLSALSLAACGGDSGTDSDKGPSESKAQYESFDDLPNCTSTREGEIAEILDDGESYICKSKKWEEYVDTDIKSYLTEDDMPNCSSKNKGALALVEADSVVQVCKDSRWETLGHPYSNEDSLPNCTKKRNGEKAYLIEEGEVQVCKDGVWGAAGDKPTSSSASKSDVDGDKPKSDGDGDKSKSDDADTKTKSSSSQESTSDGGDEIDSSSSKSVNTSTSIAPGVTEGTFTDPRDGQKYKTVKIGNQVWMAKNLNFNASGSSCYNSSLSNCETYGRMYSQSAAMDICPDGWHLPSSTEWNTLLANVPRAKMLLKENDSDGFAALLAGSSINAPGSYAIFWTSDSGKNANIGTRFNGVYDAVSGEQVYVRCIKGLKTTSSSSAKSSSSSVKSSSSIVTSSATVISSSATTPVSNYGTCTPAVTTAYLEDSVSWVFTRDVNFPLTQYANATFQWTFPNGTSKSSTSKMPKSFYSEISTYGASVVINGDTDNTITCSPKVNVAGNKVTCSCTHAGDNSINVTDGPVDVTWTANCSSAVDITGYYWDGSSINGGKTYVHAVSEGSYAPTLKVRNSQGVEVSASCGAVEGWAEAGNIVNLAQGQSVVLGSGISYVVTASSCGSIIISCRSYEVTCDSTGWPCEYKYPEVTMEYESGETKVISCKEFSNVSYYHCESSEPWFFCFSGIIYLNEGRAELNCQN